MQGKAKEAGGAPVASMTGFGRSSASIQGVSIDIEVRSVNSRFLDIILRLPAHYSSFEPELRKEISSAFSRGRIELSVFREAKDSQEKGYSFSNKLFRSIVSDVSRQLSGFEKWNDEAEARFISQLLSRREILALDGVQQSVEEEKEGLFATVREALASLQRSREAEGLSLVGDLRQRGTNLQRLSEKIAMLQTNRPEALKKRFELRLEKLLVEREIDPDRLALEVALLADRIDISEELTRIGAHLERYVDVLADPPCGRKIEFLAQELGREFNTISSKAQESEIQHLVIEAKAELEKVREQAANVE